MVDLKEDKKKAEEILNLFTERVGTMADEELGDKFITILGVAVLDEDDNLHCSHGMRSGEPFPTYLAFKLVAEINQRSVDTLVDSALDSGEMEEPT